MKSSPDDIRTALGTGTIQGYFMSRKRDRDASDVSRSGLLTLGEGNGSSPLVRRR
jgi:hypothetical protein